MKCITVDNYDVIEGIRVARAIRPHLAIGTTHQILLSDELLMRMRTCLENPDTFSGNDLRFDKVFWDVFLHRASVAIDKAWRCWLTPETDDESRERVLVLFQADLDYSGISLRGLDYPQTYPSLTASSNVQKFLVNERQRKPSVHRGEETVSRVVLCVVMNPGDSIKLNVEWYFEDVRGHWRKSDRAVKPISELTYDGSQIKVSELNWFRSSEYEIAERL